MGVNRRETKNPPLCKMQEGGVLRGTTSVRRYLTKAASNGTKMPYSHNGRHRHSLPGKPLSVRSSQGVFGKRSLSALHPPAALCAVLACLLILGHSLYRCIIAQRAKNVKHKYQKRSCQRGETSFLIEKSTRLLIFATSYAFQGLSPQHRRGARALLRCSDRPREGSYNRVARSARWQGRSASKSGCPRGRSHPVRG